MTRYHHRQPGHTLWLIMGLAVLLIAALGGGLAFFSDAETLHDLGWVLVGVVALMALVGWLFGSLTVTIDESRVELAFGPGWPRKAIPLAEIRGATPVRNPWWYGWGIRLTPHGWLWNVSGLDAVEVELADGRRTRIGTDEPRKLAAVIAAAAGL